MRVYCTFFYFRLTEQVKVDTLSPTSVSSAVKLASPGMLAVMNKVKFPVMEGGVLAAVRVKGIVGG